MFQANASLLLLALLLVGATQPARADDCDSSPCQNIGTCISGGATTYTCQCLAGFTGSDCQTDIAECGSSPCANGATCIDTNDFNLFECICPGGFVGTKCDENVDECVSSPCAQGGTCQDLIDGYSCTCRSGYTGNSCAQEINEVRHWRNRRLTLRPITKCIFML